MSKFANDTIAAHVFKLKQPCVSFGRQTNCRLLLAFPVHDMSLCLGSCLFATRGVRLRVNMIVEPSSLLCCRFKQAAANSRQRRAVATERQRQVEENKKGGWGQRPRREHQQRLTPGHGAPQNPSDPFFCCPNATSVSRVLLATIRNNCQRPEGHGNAC